MQQNKDRTRDGKGEARFRGDDSASLKSPEQDYNTLPSHIGIIKSHHKDPHEPTQYFMVHVTGHGF